MEQPASAQASYGGMAERGVSGEIAEQIWLKLAAFANYGFPREPLGQSFAYLVYASSSWIKLHHPGCVLRGVAATPSRWAFYSAALVGAGRPPPRGGGAHPRRQRAPAVGGHPRALPRLAPGTLPYASGISSVRSVGDRSWPNGSPPRRRASRTSSMEQVRAPQRGGRSPRWRRWPPRARFDALVPGRLEHPTGRRCGWPVRWPSPRGRTAWPASSPGCEARHSCRASATSEEALADLWATGVEPRRAPHPLLPRRARRRCGVVTASRAQAAVLPPVDPRDRWPAW